MCRSKNSPTRVGPVSTESMMISGRRPLADSRIRHDHGPGAAGNRRGNITDGRHFRIKVAHAHAYPPGLFVSLRDSDGEVRLGQIDQVRG